MSETRSSRPLLFVQTYFTGKSHRFYRYIHIYLCSYVYISSLFRYLSENINNNEKRIPVIVSCWVKPFFLNGEACIYSIYMMTTETTQMTPFISKVCIHKFLITCIAHKRHWQLEDLIGSCEWGFLFSEEIKLPILSWVPVYSWPVSHKMHVWYLLRVAQWFWGQETEMATP